MNQAISADLERKKTFSNWPFTQLFNGFSMSRYSSFAAMTHAVNPMIKIKGGELAWSFASTKQIPGAKMGWSKYKE